MKEKQTAAAGSGSQYNRAKLYQLILFPFNNGATNVYFILTMNYIMYHAEGVLGLAIAFATSMVTVMRVFDAFTDPIIGALIDRTSGRFGKFRPYIVLGNGIMIISSLLMYFGTRLIPDTMMSVRYIAYVVIYALYVIGYTFQTACTRSGQTCITNDPKQRPTFNLFNTIASLVGMGLTQVVASVVGGIYGYGSETFFNILIPMAVVLSAILTVLALIGIWEKDRPEYYGLGGTKQEKVKIRDYLEIFKNNHELQRLMIAGAGTKFAFSIATNTAVGCLLYACMMGNYNGLFLPMYVVGYVCSAPFFIGGVFMSQKHGQKKTLVSFTTIALVMYLIVTALMMLWQPNGDTFVLKFFIQPNGQGLSISYFNLYTLAFILCYGIGYGAYYSTADMSIPMVADCSDYETYRTGNYVPGIIGTLFSLVDKLVSSLSTTIVGLAVFGVGLSTLPDTTTPYVDGMKGLTIVLFCVVPMVAWICTLVAMRGYKLTGARMQEIQAVNAARKDAINGGMSKEEAMKKWQTIDQVPEQYLG